MTRGKTAMVCRLLKSTLESRGLGSPPDDGRPFLDERRVGDRGGERAGPFGREVPAADVAEVFLGVGCVRRRRSLAGRCWCRTGDKIGYIRISTADQNPRMQLDALEAAGCLKVYKDTATGTKAAQPQCGVGVQSLTNGIVDTTTAHGKLVFGMFALMAEYEAGLIQERTQAGLAAARSPGHKGGRKPKMTASLIDKAQRMYDARQFTIAEIATSCGVTPMTIYRHIHTDRHAKPGHEPR